MYIYFRCGGCNAKIKTRFEDRGGLVDCPGCSGELTIPNLPVGPNVAVGGYRIEEKLAEGGMGAVFKAIEMESKRPVALKVLHGNLAWDEQMVERFVREAGMMEQLDHPCIVPASRAGEDDGTWYLAMPFIEGAGLDDIVAGDGPIGEEESLTTMRLVADALDYAWREHHLVHRDIKPDNILIDYEGDPHILDMGIARCFDDSVRLTMPGEVMGTPNYMSPEQALGKEDVDYRSDMYAVGATLYFMVTGQLPFEGLSMFEAMDAADRRHRPSQRRPAADQPSAWG